MSAIFGWALALSPALLFAGVALMASRRVRRSQYPSRVRLSERFCPRCGFETRRLPDGTPMQHTLCFPREAP